MAENTKMPPNQDQRRVPSNKPSGGPGKPQKSGGPVPAGPDRDRQGVNHPGKPMPEIDPDRNRPDRNKPAPDKERPGEGSIGGDAFDDDDITPPPIDRD